MAAIKWDSECELEDYIYESMCDNKCNIATDDPINFIQRQFRIGSYGVADIVTGKAGLDPEGQSVFTIIELKKEIIKPDAVAQVIRYKAGLSRFLKTLGIEDFYIQCQLFAPKTDDDAIYLAEEIDYLTIYESQFDLSEGVLFIERGGIHRAVPDFSSDKNILSETVDATVKNNELFARQSAAKKD